MGSFPETYIDPKMLTFFRGKVCSVILSLVIFIFHDFKGKGVIAWRRGAFIQGMHKEIPHFFFYTWFYIDRLKLYQSIDIIVLHVVYFTSSIVNTNVQITQNTYDLP